MAITIITNNVPRWVIDAYELTESERAQFDYLDWDAIARGEDSASFFRYRGELHDIGEFVAFGDGPFGFSRPEWATNWDAIRTHSLFWGMGGPYFRRGGGE